MPVGDRTALRDGDGSGACFELAAALLLLPRAGDAVAAAIGEPSLPEGSTFNAGRRGDLLIAEAAEAR